MKRRVVSTVAVLALISCLAPITPARADELATKLTAIEKSLWEGWKNHDGAAFNEDLAEATLGVGEAGIEVGKARAIESIVKSKCVVKGYELGEIQVHVFGDTAVLSYRATQDAVCDGKPIPAAIYASSVFVKDGDKWLGVLHQETPVAAK